MALKKTFAELRNKWREQLLEVDRNSIKQQLLQVTWDLAVFRIVQESLKFVPQDQHGRPQINGPLLELLAGSFFKNFMVFLRRMTDGRQDVISLFRILDDMQRDSSLITRGAIFEAEGLSYDYEPIKQKEHDWRMEQLALGHTSVNIPSEYHWEFSEDRHRAIDSMVKTTADKRSPLDRIPRQLFENLKSRMVGLAGPVKTHVDHFLAHSASQERRQISSADEISITFNQLRKAHQVLCETASFLSFAILGESTGQWLAYPQYDPLEFLEMPFSSADGIGNLRQKWDEMNQESQAWSNWHVDEYDQEFGT
jgi:hypothetical protein